MNDGQRFMRDRRIEEMYQMGFKPSEIGRRFGIEAVRVRRILKERGNVIFRQDGYDDPHSVWNMDSDQQRREAVWQRQHDGAKQALKALSPDINTIHSHENEMGF